ncbi:hypothetical protein D3C72_1677730 [compost metagenome]
MQVAAAAIAVDGVLAAVKAQVLYARAQLEQWRAPGTFAAADIEHAADRPLQVVLGTGHGQGHLACQACGATGLVGLVPALEVGGVVGLVHGDHAKW